MSLLCYVAGPYTATETSTREQNIERARQVAIGLWRLGHVAICSHLNMARFEDELPEVSGRTWVEGRLTLLAVCDALVLTEHWQESRETKIEVMCAKSAGTVVYEWPNIPAAEKKR